VHDQAVRDAADDHHRQLGRPAAGSHAHQPSRIRPGQREYLDDAIAVDDEVTAREGGIGKGGEKDVHDPGDCGAALVRTAERTFDDGVIGIGGAERVHVMVVEGRDS
jgi:hypothetical protein